MFLKSLEAQGFKSFPDKTSLTFEKGITGVVGPNGSGKSNISDAIRWVLGEQSNKQLRGEKSEDVVFNGTQDRRPQGMAQVTLCLDNSDRSLACDCDEVFITRRYYRSGESEYQINHATVRLKDINELFMDTGIGRDGYSMIGQGKISDIVSRRSDERREMFEEAAGISRFRYRKTEAERKLSAAEDNLVRLRDIMAELTDRVGPLEDQCRRAKKYLEYAGEEKQLEVGLWLITLERSKERLREQEHKIDLAQAQYDETRDRIEQIIDELERSGSRTRLLTVQMDSARRTVSECEEQTARSEGQIAVCENNINHNNENIERLSSELLISGRQDDGLDQKLAERRSALAERETALSETREKLSASASELERLISDMEQSSGELDAANRELAMLSESLSGCSLRNVTASSSLSEIENRGGAVDEAIEQRRDAIARCEEEELELKKDLDRCDEKIEECKNAIRGGEMLAKAAQEKLGSSNDNINSLKLDIQTKKRRAQLLRDMENSLEGFGNTVKTVMREAERHTLSGICGPVSKLISVDGKYSTAIETALGGALQNIVTETEGDAKKAIAFLKKEKGGRATFLPISNIKGRTFDYKADGVPGFVGTADSLVSCRPEYKNIVSHLLGGIAVAEDLDSAASISKRFGYRFKTVSLDGQVVNAGGSLTGGSFSRGAGLLSRSAEIDRLQREASELESKLEFENREYERLKSVLDTRNAAVESARAEQITANEDKIRVLGELKRNGDQTETLKNSLAELENEKKGAAQRIEELRRSAADAEETAERLKNEIEQCKARRDALSIRRDGLSKTREEILMNNSAVRVKIESIEHERDAVKGEIESLELRRFDSLLAADRMRGQIEELKASNERETAQIETLRTAMAELASRAEETRLKIEERLNERTDLEAQISKLTAEERDLSARKERLGSENVRLKERKEAIAKEYDDVIAKLFDKYELTLSAAKELAIEIEDRDAAGRRLRELKGKIKALGSINLAAIDEYAEVSERYEFMKAQLSDVENAKAELERLINELVSNMQEAFNEKFALINKNFSETFVELFGGGTASLSLSDPEDVLNSGIEIRVQPPGKKVSTIEQLSGGEKSIVALAIYFAMMKVSPPPFCMLDEVESALDDVNVDRFAGYLRRMCARTQFIVVTHRRGTMEEADVLYGVTMQEKGVSKILKLEGKNY